MKVAVSSEGDTAMLAGDALQAEAFRVLAAANVPVYVGVSGTVREAVAALAAGTIQPAQAADVEGHWA